MSFFSDEDLKRLKQMADPYGSYADGVSEDVAIWILNAIPALLSRLEAAEKALNSMEYHNKYPGNHYIGAIDQDLYLSWRKTSGKGGAK